MLVQRVHLNKGASSRPASEELASARHSQRGAVWIAARCVNPRLHRLGFTVHHAPTGVQPVQRLRNLPRATTWARRKLGRKPKLTPHRQQEARRRAAAGEPIRDVARTYNVSQATISRLAA